MKLLVVFVVVLAFLQNVSNAQECKDLSGHPNYKLFNKPVCGRSRYDTDRPQSRITGGELSAIGSYPWMTIIAFTRYVDNGILKTTCGGTLISERYVLSAASCFIAPEANATEPRVMVWLRVWQSDRLDIINCNTEMCIHAPIARDAEYVLIHPKFDFTSNNGAFDVALIRLRKSVHFDDYLMPVCMPLGCNFRGWGPYAGFYVTMVGWDHRGEQRNGLNVSVLETTKMKVIENELCQEKWGSSLKIHEWQMCGSWAGGRAACAKDIGGPLLSDANMFGDVHRIFQIAIIAVDVCRFNNTQTHPNVFVSLPDFVPYLLENVKE